MPYDLTPITNHLLAHDKRFTAHDKRFDAHDKRFDEHDRRFDAHDRRFDEHDRRFDTLEHALASFREEFAEFKDRIYTILDSQTAILLKLDQENAAVSERMRRVEGRVDQHDQDIIGLKQRLAAT